MVVLVSVLLILVVPIALVLVIILIFMLLVGIFFVVIILVGILFVIILVRIFLVVVILLIGVFLVIVLVGIFLVVVVLLVIILVRGSSLGDDGQEDQGAHGDEWAHHDDPGEDNRWRCENLRRRCQTKTRRREKMM